MQQNRNSQPLADRLKIGTAALVWTAGLLLAGSDGPLMPYLNGGGVLLFAMASLWLGVALPRLEKDPAVLGPKPVPPQTARVRPPVSPDRTGILPGRTSAVRPRFARELGVV